MFHPYALLLASSLSLFANSVDANLMVSNASVRLLPPSLPNTSAYFSVKNTAEHDIILVSAQTDIAQKAELHNHVMQGQMMRMERQDLVTIGPGQTVNFEPGGLHMMIFGLKTPLKKAQSVKLSLLTQGGDIITFNAIVTEPKPQAHYH
ncbi:MAG: copper(I)-binding protein [Paraglaciecola sp.]|jgi:copper(I)-binding protein